MALTGPPFSKHISCLQEIPEKSKTVRLRPKAGLSSVDQEPLKKNGFGFKNLTETFRLNVNRAEGRFIETVRLREPAITGDDLVLEKIENVGIRVERRNGCVGWGETAVLPPVTADRAATMERVTAACEFLRRSSPAMTLDLVLDEIENILPGHEYASVRSGVEMALIDALANSIGVPLWRLFGGSSNSLSTSIKILPRSPNEIFQLVSKYSLKGFKSFKLNIGKDLKSEIEEFRTIRAVNPNCSVILDANEVYTPREAIEVLEQLQENEFLPVVLEQPVKRDDWEGLSHVRKIARDVYGISISVDESCLDLSDVQKIIREDLADVINVKLSKFGVLGALKIVDLTKDSGLDLMIDGLIETRLATGFAGHFAAGLGCFKYIILDAPFLLSEDPIIGGYEDLENLEGNKRFEA